MPKLSREEKRARRAEKKARQKEITAQKLPFGEMYRQLRELDREYSLL